MARLTASQVSALIGVSVYTLKRWYKWFETTDSETLQKLALEKGMPGLPAYDTIGATNWRYWNEEDMDQLREFKEWVPHTKNGVMGNLNKKKEE